MPCTDYHSICNSPCKVKYINKLSLDENQCNKLSQPHPGTFPTSVPMALGGSQLTPVETQVGTSALQVEIVSGLERAITHLPALNAS